jgi:FdhD protein
MKSAKQPIQYNQVSPGHWQTIDADVIVETPVSLTVNGDVWLTFMCTPVDLESMAVGFLFNEGVIKTADEVVDVRLCASGDNVDVWLNHSVEKPDKWRRTSGCSGGLTSVMSEAPAQLMTNGCVLDANQVGQLINQLFESQQLYRESGGVHTSALTDGRQTWIVAEDIGRHNTLDKIAGRCLLEGVNLPTRIILTTGRISSEMLQKSARLKASIVISRTSPSSLSIEMAEKWGITLIGYARRNRFNIYTHPERVLAPEKEKAIEEPIFK